MKSQFQTAIKDRIIDEINSFTELENGWDCGVGEPAKAETVAKAVSLYSMFRSIFLRTFRIEAHPCTDGGILLTFSKNEDFIELYINPDNTMELRHEHGIGFEYDLLVENYDATEADILYTLLRLLEQSNTQNFLQKNSGFGVISSRITMGGFLSSTKSARSNNEQSVSTLESSTQLPSKYPTFSTK